MSLPAIICLYVAIIVAVTSIALLITYISQVRELRQENAHLRRQVDMVEVFKEQSVLLHDLCSTIRQWEVLVEARRLDGDGDQVVIEAEEVTHDEAEDEQDVPDAEVRTEPLPFDPDNPPKAVVYEPKPGSEQRYCHCHRRALQQGDEVLLWPNPAVEGAKWIICPQVDDEVTI